MESFLINLMQDISGLTYLASTAALVLFGTQILKRLPLRRWFINPLPDALKRRLGLDKPIHPSLIALSLQVLLWIPFAVARNNGAGADVELWYGRIAQLIDIFGPVLLGVAGAAFATQTAYDKLNRRNVPGFRSADAPLSNSRPDTHTPTAGTAGSAGTVDGHIS